MPEETEAPNNPDNVINELLSELSTPPAEETTSTEAAPETPEPIQAAVVEETPTPEPGTELKSPFLAEQARLERQHRATLETNKQKHATEIEDAKKAVVQEMLSNPGEFVKKYGVDAGDIALKMYAEDLGDEAPPELLQQLNISKTDAASESLRSEWEAWKQEQQQQALQVQSTTILDQYTGFLNDLPQDLPYLATEVEHSSQETLRAMAELADHMYVDSGKYPSAPEVARLIEKQISDTVARYSKVTAVPAVQAPAKKPVETTTLTNDLSGGTVRPEPEGEDALYQDTLAYLKELKAAK